MDFSDLFYENRPCAALYLCWSEDSCRTAEIVCEVVNRFPADRRKVEAMIVVKI
jgi:hypothetical protein